MIKIRKANSDDAALLFKFLIDLDNQSEYLLFGQNERSISIDRIKTYLEKMTNDLSSIIFIAENEINDIIGYVCGESSQIKRISHVMKINIGILKNYRRSSTSRLLAHALLEHIKQIGILRVEATVIKENIISLNLCKKFGMRIDGIKQSSIKIGNTLHDEYLLSRLFN